MCSSIRHNHTFLFFSYVSYSDMLIVFRKFTQDRNNLSKANTFFLEKMKCLTQWGRWFPKRIKPPFSIETWSFLLLFVPSWPIVIMFKCMPPIYPREKSTPHPSPLRPTFLPENEEVGGGGRNHQRPPEKWIKREDSRFLWKLFT